MPAKAPGAGTAFPWDAAMSAGLGILRLRPRDFWQMTPRELAHALAPLTPAPSPPISRPGLADLMRRFPDG
ncbi:hypothetical protein Sa4125_12390 [Aureimonas sp. SA4125]|uniref:rcc01693 family protein n=1 Tax=Aureimonas sp. SA4125 TaxID=2826993 RepID=UPI001CC74013|nr:rcc01693 family protein [Aureimonas sp. SA4125]BDA83697.1 hypothetical protein Sa4125_12390 [Aureimonas sp. SA4125]